MKTTISVFLLIISFIFILSGVTISDNGITYSIHNNQTTYLKSGEYLFNNIE